MTNLEIILSIYTYVYPQFIVRNKVHDFESVHFSVNRKKYRIFIINSFCLIFTNKFI